MTSRIGERREHAQSEPGAEYLAKRTAILDGAARVFQRIGYDRVRMIEVAKEAGIDRASVYYYFKDKHEIFHAVIIEAVEHLVDAVESIAASDADAATKIRLLVGGVMDAYTEHYPYLYVYVQEDMNRLDSASESARTLRRLARRFTEAAESIVTSGLDGGAFKSDLNPRLVTNGILGALNWSHRWYTPGKAESAEEIAASLTEVFLNGVIDRS